jgi:hypothetical protein
MVTGNGKIICENMRDPGVYSFFPFSPLYLVNAPPDQSHFQVMLVLACHLAGLAARTLAGVEVKCELLCHII